MAKTINSATTLLCPVAEFLKRVDRVSVAELASDTDSPVDDSLLATDVNVLAALKDACGDFEAAALGGEKYAPADLVALVGTGTHAEAKMCRIIADLAWGYLYERRPSNKDLRPADSMRRSALFLDQLFAGVRILGFVEVEEAGRMESQAETAAEVETRDGATFTARRLFGRRGNRECG